MKTPPRPTNPAQALFQAHGRSFTGNRYIYPVLSRRSGGISIGVNLSGDKVCNFRCVYCQVDRAEAGETEPVDVDQLGEELDRMLQWVTSGQIYQDPKFQHVPEPLRRLNDVAFSGDGEPTLCANFEQAVRRCAEVRNRRDLEGVKLVLITNASTLHLEKVRRALAILDSEGGEIWAKLDAGTEAYYRQIARSDVSFDRILRNLCEAAAARPIVIQSLFAQIHGQPPSVPEQEAYCQRLNEISSGGGHVKLVQLHTIARPPAEAWVTALSDEQLGIFSELVRRRTGLPVAVPNWP